MTMKIDFLVDNNTLIDRYFRAEPGFSLFIDYNGTRILFDTGYSDLFMVNAGKMGINLSDLDYLVISHSHLDHTWGLSPFIRHLTELAIEGRPFKRPVLVGHPGIFDSVSIAGIPEIGCLISEEKLGRHMEIRLSSTPIPLAPGLVFLGKIPRQNEFEGASAIGTRAGRPDSIEEDSALAAVTDKGLVIITGCAHAGICSTISYAQKICGETQVADVIGGFHLQNPDPAQLEKTLGFLKTIKPERLHACHCTDLASKIALASAAPLEEVGVGLHIDYDTPDKPGGTP